MHRPSSAPTLMGEGVTLREHRAGDEAGVVEQCNDPLTQRWTTVPVPYTSAHARDYIASAHRHWRDGTAYTFAIEVADRFAGSLQLRPDGSAGLSLSYGVAAWARGRGVTIRALRVLLPWAFRTLGPDVVLWSAVAGNWASRRVAWGVGIRVEGTVRGFAEQRGVRLDAWIGSIRHGDLLAPAHPWFDPPMITGGGVALRPHSSQDLPAMAQACNDPLTQRWLTQLPRPYTTDDARGHLEEIAEEHAAGRALFWAIADAETGLLAGEIGLWGIAQGESRSGELGYWMHPASRGRGLARVAVRLAARHGLLSGEDGGVGLARLVIRVATGNVASQQVARHAGFVPTGRDRQAQVLRDGTAVDLLRYDRLRGEAG